MEQIELWKDIKNYEGLYQISNYGRVKALEKSVWTGKYFKYYPEIILKLTSDKDGYLCITLHKDGKAKSFKVHRLVAEAFIPNPDNKPTVNHKNGDKTKNYVDNLEWMTNKENTAHARRTGLMKENQYGKNNYMYGKYGKDNPNSISVIQIDKNTNNVIKEFYSIIDAQREININATHIIDVCKGRRKTAGGYKWKYKNK